MSYVMGPKGQIVVAKELRDHLGVGPGWTALQRVNGDHLEVYFVPPSHRKSLRAHLDERLRAMQGGLPRQDGGSDPTASSVIEASDGNTALPSDALPGGETRLKQSGRIS